jgi:succinyl-CoA synthetase alpha subunit
MSILVNENTRVVVQGLTGREGSFHGEKMMEYGTKVVAGVTPGKGGQTALGLPVFNTVKEAVAATGADTSVIFVPAAFSADSACEAADAGIKLVVLITEHIPVLDMIRAKAYLNERGTLLIGPNCPGIISPGKCKIGIQPGYIHKQGNIGLISRSGTLTYEAVHQLTTNGLGQSTCIGIGGDPVPGLKFIDLLDMFRGDPQTEAVCMLGEIGGDNEEKAARYVKETKYPKPVFGFIAGLTAPPGKRMGHAGAIISGSKGRGEDKIAAMEDAGIVVIKELGRFGETVAEHMSL